MLKAISFFFLSILLLASFAGCSSLLGGGAPAAPEVTAEAPKVTLPPSPPPRPRELGSIWSESSRWNVIYSPPAGRNVGEIIFIRPSDSLKLSVASKGDKLPNPDPNLTTKENTHIVAIIRDVLPRGVYAIDAKQALKVGLRDYDVSIEGKVREQDISNDDSTNSDSVFDLKLAVANTVVDPKAVPADGSAVKTDDKKVADAAKAKDAKAEEGKK